MTDKPHESDEILMNRVARGDAGAFETLLLRYENRVLNFANQLVRNRTTAEDIVQTTFLRLFQSAPRYKPAGKFVGYLFRIARNLALNELAKKRPGGGLEQEPSSSKYDPASRALSAEEDSRVRGALENLSPADREIVWLRIYEKMPYREIAELTGTREGAARSRMRYALEDLARLLGGRRGPG
ncbi:MAG: RNA polymerase sigma factor [Planctomycetota bacterium]|jgi:RNA polymerase sigma-70 factor (ECF subfamily)